MSIYGLPQEGILANEQTIKKLVPDGYEPAKYTPGLWQHEHKKIFFALCVDDYLIKYETKEDANHLLKALKENYRISTDWEASLYCGVTL